MFVLTDEQEKAIEKAKKWYLNDKITKPFIILGPAGSGKSSIVKYIIEGVGIKKENAKYVTFTGKAASVLIKKGVDATTIHRLIYNPIIGKNGMVIGFEKKEELTDDIKLIIVDEFYMVSEGIMKDLLSYGIKTICLGDNYQLPPPFGKVLSNYKPDVKLTKILRQNLDNPILYLAEQAKSHKKIKIGDYGDDIKVISKDNLDLERLKNCNQIIVGKNNTVSKMNNFYRKYLLNIDTDKYKIPLKGEKLICLKNNWNLEATENHITTSLVNGLTVELLTELDLNPNLTMVDLVDLKPDFFENHMFKNVHMDRLFFQFDLNNYNNLYNPEIIEKYKYQLILDKRKMRFDINDIACLTYGYAITCHRAQGSEYDDVFFIFEPFKNSLNDIYWQSLYTGITRASKKLILAI